MEIDFCGKGLLFWRGKFFSLFQNKAALQTLGWNAFTGKKHLKLWRWIVRIFEYLKQEKATLSELDFLRIDAVDYWYKYDDKKYCKFSFTFYIIIQNWGILWIKMAKIGYIFNDGIAIMDQARFKLSFILWHICYKDFFLAAWFSFKIIYSWKNLWKFKFLLVF